jgi:hypothetical protein
VYTKVEDAITLKKRVKGFELFRVASGSTSLGDGHLLPTPSDESDSHHTWWLFDGVRVVERFKVIESEGE